ncbi:hypothetical protein MTO96_012302 [Rhipicephalus appendiculatus]
MQTVIRKEFLVRCILLLAARRWLGAEAANTTIDLDKVTTPAANSPPDYTTAFVTSQATTAYTQGTNATTMSPYTTSASTVSTVSDATTAAVVSGGCDERVCRRPSCACESDQPPAGLQRSLVPQFVTLTFDDAVNVGNMVFYRELLNGNRKNKKNNCSIAATFFVSHDYTDYEAVNQLYSWGNEIALHSISHRTDSTYWQTINTTQWEREVAAQKEMMEILANVPASNVTGFRGPFLYNGGDAAFRMLQKHFRYDCTLVHQRERRHDPVYPYTMDYGFRRSCMVWPCPKDTYAGLWVVPMNVLFKERSGQDYPCAMADACLPHPLTANETFEYLRSNFEDYYNTSRAPFPLFVHEAYLRHPGRKQGYLQFIDWLLTKDDVYLVTISEMLHYMKNPQPLTTYAQQACPGRGTTGQRNTCTKPQTCTYRNTSLGGDRYMKICSQCPKNYPWVGNPEGN